MRSEKGAITLYVTVVCLFIMIIGISAYVGTNNRQASQLAALNEVEKQYNDTQLVAEDLYLAYDGGDIVPVYTPEQFAMVGTGEEVFVEQTGKIYTFSADKTYLFYGAADDFATLLTTLKNQVKIELAVASEVVTAVAESVTLYEGVNNNLEKYFAYTENEDNLVSSIVFTDTCHSNTVITNAKTLDAGEHTIKCTVTKANGVVASAIKEITVKSSGLAKENTVIKPDANSNLQIVVPAGFGIAILESGTTSSAVTQSGKVVSIMPQEQWSSITTAQINKGIVVVDNVITYDGGYATGAVPDFNEYVWVPIPDSSKFARTAWVGPYNNNGTWTNGTHPLATTSTSLMYWEDQTTEEYTDMVSSVTTNKGFYIGRYEASVEQGSIAQSKRDQVPRRYVSQINSITYSANNPTANTHLIYGVEWDSVLNWLIGNAVIESTTIWTTKTMELADVATDSRSWGNYNNSTGNAARGAGEIKETGWNEYWKANNIYDLAGNAYEWTQECYSTGSYRALRGGSCYHNGDNDPVAYRNYGSAVNSSTGLRLPFQLLFVALIYRGRFPMGYFTPLGTHLCENQGE